MKDEGLCSSEFQLQCTVSTWRLNSLSEVLKSGAQKHLPVSKLQTAHKITRWNTKKPNSKFMGLRV